MCPPAPLKPRHYGAIEVLLLLLNDYPPIRFEIRFEGKFPIRRCLARQSVMAGRDKQYVTCDMHVETNVSPVGILVMLSFC